MNQEVQKVTFWLSANKLSLNANKTRYTVIKAKYINENI